MTDQPPAGTPDGFDTQLEAALQRAAAGESLDDFPKEIVDLVMLAGALPTEPTAVVPPDLLGTVTDTVMAEAAGLSSDTAAQLEASTVPGANDPTPPMGIPPVASPPPPPAAPAGTPPTPPPPGKPSSAFPSWFPWALGAAIIAIIILLMALLGGSDGEPDLDHVSVSDAATTEASDPATSPSPTEPSPEPTSESSEPSPEPTTENSPTPSTDPSPTPTATASPRPTQSATPTPTVSATPTESATPTPTPTPTPTESATPTASETPTTPTNQRPTANDDRGEVPAGGNGSVTIDILANDTDPNGATDIDPTCVEIVQWPEYGALEVNDDGTVTYTMSPIGGADDQFTYKVCDAAGAYSNTATVTVLVP